MGRTQGMSGGDQASWRGHLEILCEFSVSIIKCMESILTTGRQSGVVMVKYTNSCIIIYTCCDMCSSSGVYYLMCMRS